MNRSRGTYGATLAFLVVTASMSVPAVAVDPSDPDPTVTPHPENDEFLVELEVHGQPTPGESQAGTADGPAPYTYEFVVADEGCLAPGVYCGGIEPCQDGGSLAVQYQNDDAGQPIEDSGTPACVNTTSSISEGVTGLLVLQALYRIPLPESRLVLDPERKTLVNFDTIFSTRANGFVRSVTLLGQPVTLDITPSRFTWDHGDQTALVTDFPGLSWRRSVPVESGRYLTHQYLHAGIVKPSVHTTWSATYRVGNGPWLTVPGTITITGDPVPLHVLEAPPVLAGSQ